MNNINLRVHLIRKKCNVDLISFALIHITKTQMYSTAFSTKWIAHHTWNHAFMKKKIRDPDMEVNENKRTSNCRGRTQ